MELLNEILLKELSPLVVDYIPLEEQLLFCKENEKSNLVDKIINEIENNDMIYYDYNWWIFNNMNLLDLSTFTMFVEKTKIELDWTILNEAILEKKFDIIEWLAKKGCKANFIAFSNIMSIGLKMLNFTYKLNIFEFDDENARTVMDIMSKSKTKKLQNWYHENVIR